jgi:hypothetical protein
MHFGSQTGTTKQNWYSQTGRLSLNFASDMNNRDTIRDTKFLLVLKWIM